MSAIKRVTSSAGVPLAATRRDTPDPAPLTTPDNRALAPLQSTLRAERRPRERPDAAFLAHLIATREQLPQTRLRRRGEPGEAAVAYASGMTVSGAAAGAVLSRST
jgi:hypothetical protein